MGIWNAKWYHTDARAQPKIPKLLVSAHEVFFEEFICLGLQNCVMHRAKPLKDQGIQYCYYFQVRKLSCDQARDPVS